jgi:hypothetical protein
MRRWQLTGLVVGAAALFFTARPAQAQVWVGPPIVSPAPPSWSALPSWSAPAGDPGRTGACDAPTVPSAAPAGTVRHGDRGGAW